MQTLSADTLNDARKQLEEEKTKIVAQIADLSAQDPFSDPERLVDNAATDAVASEESSHDRFTAQVEQLTAKRDAINDALFRISDGSYGVCTSCGDVIDEKRLRILPTATLCMACENKK